MKPIIGIINRSETLPSNNKICYIYEDLANKIKEAGGIPIGIEKENIKDILNITNGLVIQGGDKYEEDELKIIRYAYKSNIPTLGICLGMQLMALATGSELKKVKNHMNRKKYHEIRIIKNTKLYQILNKEKIIVNTRHNYAVKNTSLTVSGISNNIIEAIEDNKKTFFIGLQWHPESMNNDDTKKIFKKFIESVKK